MNTSSYIYGTSFFHRMDARPELLLSVLYSFLVFFVHSWYGLILFAAAPVLSYCFSLGPAETWRGVRRLLPVLVLLFLFLPLQDRSGVPLLAAGDSVLVTAEGLYRVCRLASRFISVSFALMLLIATARSEELVRALRYFHLPYTFSLLLSMILRFIPYLGSLFESISDSMSLRLREGKHGFPVMPSITAFAVAAVRMIPETAAALEERGFGSGKGRGYDRPESSLRLFTELLLSAILPTIFFLIVR